MKLQEFIEREKLSWFQHESKAIGLFHHNWDQDLQWRVFHLSDYVVTSVTGVMYWLCPRGQNNADMDQA